MAFFKTKLNKTEYVMLEAETSGAFVKSDLEVRPDPETALLTALDTVAKVAVSLGEKMAGATASTEITFGVKIQPTGLVLISQRPDDGQISCTIGVMPD